MATVAVIDDRSEPRTTLARLLEMSLSSISGEWVTINAPPLPQLQDYPGWLAENEVAALILDERLQEQTEDAEGHVDYDGHELVDFLRDRDLDLPLYVITAVPDDPDLGKRFGRVEAIIGRDEFREKAPAFAERIARSGLRFLEEHQARLAEIADRSTRIAMGSASTEDVGRLRALQEALRIPLESEGLIDQGQWLHDLDNQVKRLEGLKEEIEDYLAGHSEEK